MKPFSPSVYMSVSVASERHAKHVDLLTHREVETLITGKRLPPSYLGHETRESVVFDDVSRQTDPCT